MEAHSHVRIGVSWFQSGLLINKNLREEGFFSGRGTTVIASKRVFPWQTLALILAPCEVFTEACAPLVVSERNRQLKTSNIAANKYLIVVNIRKNRLFS